MWDAQRMSRLQGRLGWRKREVEGNFERVVARKLREARGSRKEETSKGPWGASLVAQ